MMTSKTRTYLWYLSLLVTVGIYLAVSYRELSPPTFISPISLPAAKPGLPAIEIPAQPGIPLLINFFASWCHYCTKEEPELRTLQSMMRGSKGQIIGIASHDTRDALVRSGKLEQRPFQIALDISGDYTEKLRIDGVPQTILVDPTGKIVYHVRGQLTPYHVKAIGQKLTPMTGSKTL
jgi:thiol-disulfide isomerase/thioredoxin